MVSVGAETQRCRRSVIMVILEVQLTCFLGTASIDDDTNVFHHDCNAEDPNFAQRPNVECSQVELSDRLGCSSTGFTYEQLRLSNKSESRYIQKDET